MNVSDQLCSQGESIHLDKSDDVAGTLDVDKACLSNGDACCIIDMFGAEFQNYMDKSSSCCTWKTCLMLERAAKIG